MEVQPRTLMRVDGLRLMSASERRPWPGGWLSEPCRHFRHTTGYQDAGYRLSAHCEFNLDVALVMCPSRELPTAVRRALGVPRRSIPPIQRHRPAPAAR